MNSDIENIFRFLGSKDPVSHFLLNSKSLIIGLFERSGDLIFANHGLQSFLSLLDQSNSPVTALVNPDWEKIINLQGTGRIFTGKMTIGDKYYKNYSFDSEIFNQNDKILILGDADALELFSQNDQLSVLNQQVNSLQRQLIKEKISLEKAMLELERLNQEKNRYIGMVAHDLRSPIGLAKSFAGLLLKECLNNSIEENHKQLEIINRSCTFSLNLISDMLDLSKIEAGIIEMNVRTYDYIEFCRTVVEMNRIFAKQKNQEILFIAEPAALSLNFDSNKMEQVLNNLLTNALKFSLPDKIIQVKISVSGSHVITSIIDEGQGILPNELQTIFNPFIHGSVKATTGENSSGLGLAIVKRVIMAHNGLIKVSSEPGKGSDFTYELPLSEG